MAIPCPLLATSLLFCSLLVIASANDYSYADSSKNQAYGYGTKPEGEEKNKYETKPLPKGEEKPRYDAKPDLNQPQPEYKEQPDYVTSPPVYQPQPEYKEQPDYVTNPPVYQPQPEYKEQPDYVTNPPVYQPQPEKPVSGKEEKPDYGTKPNSYKPEPEDKEKPESEKEEKPDDGTENNFYKPQPEEEEKPESEVLPIGVQGLVLCKSGSKYYPIQGALARITCLAVDENGYEKPHSVCSGETDAKGYFFVRLSPLGLDNIDDRLSKFTECKAFLESSPLETCNVPVDVNKGISGAPLSDFRVLNQKRIKLYSVGPFFFTPEPNSVPNGY